MCEVETVLNSRPLTPINDVPTDFNALTPQHFLSKPFESDGLTPANCYRSKWKSVISASNIFWNRFVKLYLPTLQQRKKWNKTNERNLEVNDLVITQTENVPRLHWPLARIVETIKGRDDVVRVCKVVLPNKQTLMRPARRLYLLESLKN